MAFLLAGCPAAERPYQLLPADFMQPCRKLTKIKALKIDKNRYKTAPRP
jgi:hypothetical protein